MGNRYMMKWVGMVAVYFLLMASASAGSRVECAFNDLSDGAVDGQPGWNVFDKVKNSSACSVASGVGTTEAAEDKALVVKKSSSSIRCVTDEAVRWLRKQTDRGLEN